SDSCFSQQWAELLAHGYGRGLWSHDVSEGALADAQAQWQAYVSKLDLPWYAAEKVELGAYAAVVGMTIRQDDRTWDVVALGDSCLFHIRKGRIVASSPLTRSSEFGSLPYLLASNPGNNDEALDRKLVRLNNKWMSGDIFLLLSDALAAWLLRQRETRAEARALRSLCELQTAGEFAEFVAKNRSKLDRDKRPALHDDDTTMIRVCVLG